MTRARNNFGIGHLNLAFNAVRSFSLSFQGQVLVSRQIGKVKASTHMDGFRVNRDLAFTESVGF